MQIKMKKVILLLAVLCVLMILVISQKEIQAKTSSARLDSLRSGNNAAKIDGFRSAKFGMNVPDLRTPITSNPLRLAILHFGKSVILYLAALSQKEI